LVADQAPIFGSEGLLAAGLVLAIPMILLLVDGPTVAAEGGGCSLIAVASTRLKKLVI
jgi:hypothetical protein